ncbi:unnamed protein product [Agarophyton chilense]|eukprot:gb/GEZJ01000082.1/.p1 GENE.gb/GEZJ01000082.1/~~gb/GEZJ01000082.1/.p1  ORF type:complete len:924 (+),score=137.04 gb/GEZJ01000082.1/:7945-10716(+)
MAFGGSGFGGNLFGNTQSAFGTPAPVFGQSSSFGASSSGFGAASSGFGAFAQPQSQSPWGTGTVPTFGQQNVFQQQPVGNPQSTRAVKWQVSQLQDSNSSDPSRFHSISAMNQFQQYTVEELRVSDYARGDKGGPQSGFGAPSGMEGSSFGSSGFGQSAPGFGGAANTFGSSSQSLFGNTTGFGGSNTLFGQTQQQQQATGFGSFGQAQSGFGQQPSGFGQSSSGFGASSGGVFGAAVFGGNTGFGQTAAQSTGFGSGFGNPGGTGFGAASASGFGSQGSAPSGFGASGFGASSQSLFGGGGQQTGGVFGTQQTGTSLFGQQSGAAGFGAPTQSAPSLFGAQSSGGSLFGGQQQTAGGLFGSGQSSAPGLFGGTQQSSGGLFGGQQGATGQFGASSGAFGGSNLFGGSSQPSTSLFGGSGLGSTPSGGLFGSGSSGSSLFGNTGGGLFGSGTGTGFGAPSSNLFGTQPSGSLFGNTGSGFGTTGSMFGSGSSFGSFGFGSQQQPQAQQQQGPLEASLTSNPFGYSNLFANIPKDNSVTLLPLGSSQSQDTQGKTVSVVVGPIGGLSRRSRVGDEHQTRLPNGSRITTDSWYRPRARPWSRNGTLFDLDDMMRGKDHARDFVTPWRTEEQRVRARNLKKLVIEPIEEDPILRGPDQNAGVSIRRKVRSDDETSAPPRQTEYRLQRSQPSLIKNMAEAFQHEVQDDKEETVVEADEFVSVEFPKKDEQFDRTEHDVKKEGEVLESSRLVPYSELYRNQFSNERRKPNNDETPHTDVGSKINIVPVCRRPNYVTVPSMDELGNMSEEELSHVEGFAIYRENVGDVRWETPVDIRGLNLDEIVSIEPGTVTIYPSNDAVPQPGEELNKPAIVRMHGVWKKKGGVVQKDAQSVAKMVRNLKHHCDREGLQFRGYDVGTGTWSFRAQRF